MLLHLIVHIFLGHFMQHQMPLKDIYTLFGKKKTELWSNNTAANSVKLYWRIFINLKKVNASLLKLFTLFYWFSWIFFFFLKWAKIHSLFVFLTIYRTNSRRLQFIKCIGSKKWSKLERVWNCWNHRLRWFTKFLLHFWRSNHSLLHFLAWCSPFRRWDSIIFGWIRKRTDKFRIDSFEGSWNVHLKNLLFQF